MAGRETVPLRVVARERDRLLGARSRHRLADRFEYYARAVSEPPCSRWGAPNPFADILVARAVRRELLMVAALIRRGNRCACGIACAEQLLRQGFLITHGGDEALLREELRRVIEQLQVAATTR
jgi:hypothetical protein